MIPFIEPRVHITDKKEIKQYDEIAKRIGLSGYAVLGKKFQKKAKPDSKNEFVKQYSRFEIDENQVGKVRNLLPKVRHSYELISVKTTSAKVAQWVIKDNRVDILVIHTKNIKELINHQLANVAASNQTFFEIDLSFLLDQKTSNKSFHLRAIARCLNILMKEQAPFIFTTNVQDSLDFRDVRAIIALANLVGVPSKIIKENLKRFYERVTLNNKKLSEEFVAPGVWIKNEKGKEKKIKETAEQQDIEDLLDDLELPLSLQQMSSVNDKSERQRYLLFEILTKEKFNTDEKEFAKQIWKRFSLYFGEVGSSRMGLYITHYNVEKKIGIIRCSHYTLESLRAVLSTITEISNCKVLIHIIKVSGTLRNLITIHRRKSE
ncbi:MAG: hypothetical protein HZR80_07510 [Candidatus Heimdallarchaeota archaeon]